MLAVDYSGIALVITAIGSTAGLLATAIVQLRASRKADARQGELLANQEAIHTLVDGKSSQQLREITALKQEIARVNRTAEATTPEQPAGEGGAPVGIDHGVVSVEQPSHDKRSGDQPILPVLPEESDETPP